MPPQFSRSYYSIFLILLLIPNILCAAGEIEAWEDPDQNIFAAKTDLAVLNTTTETVLFEKTQKTGDLIARHIVYLGSETVKGVEAFGSAFAVVMLGLEGRAGLGVATTGWGYSPHLLFSLNGLIGAGGGARAGIGTFKLPNHGSTQELIRADGEQNVSLELYGGFSTPHSQSEIAGSGSYLLAGYSLGVAFGEGTNVRARVPFLFIPKKTGIEAISILYHYDKSLRAFQDGDLTKANQFLVKTLDLLSQNGWLLDQNYESQNSGRHKELLTKLRSRLVPSDINFLRARARISPFRNACLNLLKMASHLSPK